MKCQGSSVKMILFLFTIHATYQQTCLLQVIDFNLNSDNNGLSNPGPYWFASLKKFNNIYAGIGDNKKISIFALKR
jgi:hypothetical protein